MQTAAGRMMVTRDVSAALGGRGPDGPLRPEWGRPDEAALVQGGGARPGAAGAREELASPRANAHVRLSNR
jgi:hypothetical protein